MDNLGIAQNWLGSMTFRIVGPTYINTTATLESDGVSDMGLMCFDTFVLGFSVGNGMTSANFQGKGSSCSANELFRIWVMGLARKWAYSFRSQFPIPSGPEAFLGFSCRRAVCTEETGSVGISESLSYLGRFSRHLFTQTNITCRSALRC